MNRPKLFAELTDSQLQRLRLHSPEKIAQEKYSFCRTKYRQTDFLISENDTQFAEHSLPTISNANPSHFWSLGITSGQ